MKNSEDHIDNLFKDNLENQSFDIPVEFITDLNDRLNKAMPIKRKRRGGIFFFLLNGLFLLIFMTFCFTDYLPIHPPRLANTNAELGMQYLASNEKVLVDSGVDMASCEPIASTENTLNAKDSNTAKKAIERTESINTVFNKQQTYSDDLRSHNQDQPLRGQSRVNGNNTFELPGKSVSSTSTASKVIGKENDMLFKNSSDLNLPPDTIIIHDTVIVYDTVQLVDTIRVPTIASIHSKDATNWNVELAIGAGFNYGAERFTKTTSSSASYLLEEGSIMTPSFGFNINATRNKVGIGSGIEFFQTGERFALNLNSFTQVDTIEVVGFDTILVNLPTPPNDTIFIPIYDSVSYFDTITSSENWINSYSWLSIPLNFGYFFDFGKWALIPRVGVSFNIGMHNSTGDYPSVSGNDLVLSSVAPVAFNLDYQLQLEIRKKLKKAELFVSASNRGNIIPMISNAPSRKFQSFGLRFGVAVNL